MRKIFLSIFSFVFLTGLLLTAYPVEAQRKSRVVKKPGVTSKSKTASKKPVTSIKKTVPTQATVQQVVPNRTIQNLLARMGTNTNIYRRELIRALITSNLKGTDSEDTINAYTSDFEDATKALRSRVDTATDSVADVQDVLSRAEFIQGFLLDNPLSPSVQSQWKILRDNLLTLAKSYNVSWNINTAPAQNNQAYIPNNQQTTPLDQPNYSRAERSNASARFDSMLTGTYRLNVSQSDNVGAVLDRAFQNNININNQTNAARDQRMRNNLERRLTPTQMLVLEKGNNQVTIASDLSPQVTFAADNVARTEVNTNGRSVSVKAAALSNVLEISYQGDRTNDFFMTFMPVDNDQLRVTRRIYLENREQTVTVTSVYDKILPNADFSIVNTNPNTARNNTNNSNTTNNPSSIISNDFVIPNGTELNAVLNSSLSTQTAREGDRFTMEVRSPSQYAGAIIQGYVSNTQQSSQVTNRAQVTFNFDKIQLRNGGSYSFNGLVDLIRLPSGDMVSVINEPAGNVNQPRTQTTRPGVGSALGAIFGAILGGGQNVPSEPTVAGGTGSGTIILQGHNNVILQSGSQFRIISSAPANLRANN